MLWIFFLIGIFIMLQKNTFVQKKFQISCKGLKVPFWQKWKIYAGKRYKKGIFSDVQWWKQISTHFSDSTHQECMIFARIGHGPCYYHWNEIFAGVMHHITRTCLFQRRTQNHPWAVGPRMVLCPSGFINFCQQKTCAPIRIFQTSHRGWSTAKIMYEIL